MSKSYVRTGFITRERMLNMNRRRQKKAQKFFYRHSEIGYYIDTHTMKIQVIAAVPIEQITLTMRFAE